MTVTAFLAIAVCLVPPLAARQPVRARHAMVVTRETHATDAGVAVLRNGGNAVDAAVAVGFALAVTHPSAGNLGGGGFLLLRRADGRTFFLDFRERAPERASRDMYRDRPSDSIVGYRAAGVPGTVRGLETAHRKFGRKPWAELLQPAIQLAERGFPVSRGLAADLRSSVTRKLLETDAESRRIFLRGLEAGQTFVQPELASTLRRISSQGSRDFYEGETARRLAAAMEAHGGLVSLQDLREYAAVERTPLQGSYRGYRIISAPPPSSGGLGILQMTGMLEGTGYEKSGAGSAAAIHYVAETMRRFFADRSAWMGDPDFVRVPVAGLLNPGYLARLRQSIDPLHATPSSRIRPGEPATDEGPSTTHYSIVDAEGNAVSVTYTLNNSYGCGATVPGLGFLLNDEMDDFAARPGSPNMFGLVQGEANAIAPRKRPLSCMTPTIVECDGRLLLVLGSPGGPRIINAVLEVLLNVLDFRMNVQEAVDWPRFHQQWLPDRILAEPGVSPDTVAGLEARGQHVERIRSMGEVAAIQVEDGALAGAADPRCEATAAGY